MESEFYGIFKTWIMCVPRVAHGGEMKKYQTDIFKKFYIDVYDLWFCLWDYVIKIVMKDNSMSYYSMGSCGYQVHRIQHLTRGVASVGINKYFQNMYTARKTAIIKLYVGHWS